MGTRIRPEITEKSKYWIPRHRYYELKHFCLQYPAWKQMYKILDNAGVPSLKQIGVPVSNTPGDPVGNRATIKAYYGKKIELLEQTAEKADEYIGRYILKAVTEELSYTYLRSKLDIPCGKDMYYDRYRKFFWLLSQTRD